MNLQILNDLKSSFASLEVTEEQKEALKTATKVDVLAGIAQTSATGAVPNAVTECMIKKTIEYFDKNTGEFDFDKWSEALLECNTIIIADPIQVGGGGGVVIKPAVIVPLLIGYGIGMTVAFILK